MSKPPVTFSLLGCGRMGSNYLSMFANNLVVNAEITAVCDIREVALNRTACEYKTKNFDDLLEKHMPENIIIATDSALHFEHSKKAIEAGKNIVVEKPVTIKSSHALELNRLAIEKDVLVFPVLQHRCNPKLQNLKKIVDSGEIGKTILVTGSLVWCREQSYFDQAAWRGRLNTDGGVLLNQGIHLIDLVDWLFGPLELINAIEGQKLCQIEAPETVVCNFQNKNSTIINLCLTLAARPEDQKTSLSVISESGYMALEGKALDKIVVQHTLLEEVQLEQVISQSKKEVFDSLGIPQVYGQYHVNYLNKVVETLNRLAAQPIDLKSAHRSIALIEKIFEQLASQAHS